MQSGGRGVDLGAIEAAAREEFDTKHAARERALV